MIKFCCFEIFGYANFSLKKLPRYRKINGGKVFFVKDNIYELEKIIKTKKEQGKSCLPFPELMIYEKIKFYIYQLLDLCEKKENYIDIKQKILIKIKDFFKKIISEFLIALIIDFIMRLIFP